jgi:predicted acyltransferase (DUF342 family)
MSNTYIQIKRSSATGTPGSLKAGELAYSYLSNTLFLGTASGTGVINVGGLLYTQTIDQATSANTAGTLVRRDNNNSFQGFLAGTANSTINLLNPQNFSISGGDITATAQSFGGNNAVTLNASLNSVAGLTAGSYGSTTQIPVVGVSANGRVTTISTVALSSYIPIVANTGSGNQYTGNNFTIEGNGTGIVTTVSGTGGAQTVFISTDSTVVRSNTAAVGTQTIGTDLNVSGNLTVSGTTTYINTAILQTQESMIHLAGNNTVGDVVDIGFVGYYNNGSSNVATGLVRDAGNKNYYLFSGINSSSVSGNTIANNLFTTGATATLYANINAPTVNVSALGVSGSANVAGNLGLAGNAYIQGNQVVTGTSTLTGQANTTNDMGVGGNLYLTGKQTIGSSLTVTGTTTLTGQANTTSNMGVGGNLYVAGRTTIAGQANTVNDIGIGGNAYITGSLAASSLSLTSALTVPSGGTGQSSFNAGQIIVGNGSGALQQIANVSSINTSVSSNNTVSSLVSDVYGRITSFTTQAISGLTVGQGGTGLASITQNGITFGNGSGALGVTSAAGAADQTWTNQILTVTNAGTPVWASALDGGTF